MGFFSSSTKYNAHAGSSALIGEDQRQDTIKGLILQATADDGLSPFDAVTVGANINMYARARAMLKYAAKPDGYLLGFPETDQDVLVVDSADVQAAIEADIGEAVTVHSVNTGQQNSGDLLSTALAAVYMDPVYFPWPSGDPLNTTYNIGASEVEIPVDNPDHDPTGTPPVNQPYYLADNPPDYVQIYTTEWVDGPYGEPYEVQVPTGTYRVTFSYTDNAGSPQTWTVPTPIEPAGSTGGSVISATYSRVSTPDVTETWSYEVGTGGPLDGAIDTESLYMQYLPIVVLMHDTLWFDELSNPELERTTKKILKKLALDPYDLKEEYIASVEEAIENGDRPGEKKLDDWDFFVQFAVPLFTRTRGSREYLMEYFKSIAHAMPSREQYENFLTNGGTQPYGELHITEYGDQGYNAFYRYGYIAHKKVIGEYTPPGWDVPLRHRRAYSKVYKFSDADYAEGIEEMHGEGALAYVHGGGDDQPEGQEHSYIIITTQRTIDGVPQYEQLLCMGPSMKYVVNTRADPNKAGEYRDREAIVELWPEDLEEESEFRIPVHAASMRALPFMHREEMLQDALCATVYLVEKIKVKWYQKSFFKWLIIIVVIVIIVLIQQYHLLSYVKELAVAAFAAGATAAGIGFIALYVAVSFAIGFLISFAGALIGGDFGKIFVIVASLYTAGGAQIFSNIGQTWSAMVGNLGWGTAGAFLSAIRPIVDIGSIIIQRLETAKLESEMKDFLKTAREKQEELRDAWDRLGSETSGVDATYLTQQFFTAGLGESASSYLNRTLNANPGVMGYDLINNFAEIMLTPVTDGEPNPLNLMFEEMARQRGAV